MLAVLLKSITVLCFSLIFSNEKRYLQAHFDKQVSKMLDECEDHQLSQNNKEVSPVKYSCRIVGRINQDS